MVVLKKIKASTLMETLVATVLIVVVFMMASMILNNLFSNTIRSNTREIDAYLNELQYLYKTEQLELPYENNLSDWQVSIYKVIGTRTSIVEFEATNRSTNKTIIKEVYETVE